jgi:hypothetical protein
MVPNQLMTLNQSQCQSNIYHDQRAAEQSVLMSGHQLGHVTKCFFVLDFFYLSSCEFLNMGTLSNERMGLQFTAAAGSSQHILFCVRLPRESWPDFLVPV